MKPILKLFLVLVFLFTQILAQKEIVGNWDGKIKMLSMELNFQIKVEKSNRTLDAFLSIPSQKLKDYQLLVFSFKKKWESSEVPNPDKSGLRESLRRSPYGPSDIPSGKVYFELPGQAGVAKFDGELKADSIKGELIQAGIKGTFFLARTTEQKLASQTEQKIEELLPYLEEEVAFKSGRILLSGSLTLPSKEGKYPAVILLTGSGPQNRDEEILGFKIFQRIADYLTRLGIAVLRYDDRGVGGSTGNTMQSTTEDFANDAIAAVEFLKKQKNIDHKKIGFMGHSEGGIIAPLAAANSNDIAFMILISGSGVDGGEVLLEQQRLILKAGGVADSLIEQNLDLQKKINEVLKNDKDLNEIRNDIKTFAEKDFANLSAEVKASIQDKDAYINSTVQSQIHLFNNPWFRFFVKYNPASALENIKVPVLLTFGELDLQVPAAQNRPKMEEALLKGGNKKFKSIVFPKANHLYQEAKSGSPGEYPELQKEFVPGFLETVGNWILEITK